MTTKPGTLCDYASGNDLRPATAAETKESMMAAIDDGGVGVIKVDGRSCYVYGGSVEYTINVIDSETPPCWGGCTIVDVGPQDIGRCRFRVRTTDAAALESALNADDGVLEYEAL